MSTTTIFTTLDHVECYKCHVVFGIESRHRQRLLDDGGEFFCPNGHGQIYSRTTTQKLKSKIEQLEAQVARERDRAKSAEQSADHFRKSRDGMKGALVKVKRRVAAGVCPCCTRTFQNLHRHMERKHPEYTEAKQ